MSSNQIMEKFQKIPLGEKIILIAGPLLFIDTFLPWYSVSCINTIAGCIGGGSINGWSAPGAIWSILAGLVGLAAAGLVGVTAFSTVKMPALPQGVTWARVYLGLGIAGIVCILLKLAAHSGNMGFGFFLGIILVAALVVGGGLLFQAEGGFASFSGGKGGGTTGSTM
jgi:hypothetical protein